MFLGWNSFNDGLAFGHVAHGTKYVGASFVKRSKCLNVQTRRYPSDKKNFVGQSAGETLVLNNLEGCGTSSRLLLPLQSTQLAHLDCNKIKPATSVMATDKNNSINPSASRDVNAM